MKLYKTSLILGEKFALVHVICINEVFNVMETCQAVRVPGECDLKAKKTLTVERKKNQTFFEETSTQNRCAALVRKGTEGL